VIWTDKPGLPPVEISFILLAALFIGLTIYDGIHGKNFNPHLVSLVFYPFVLDVFSLSSPNGLFSKPPVVNLFKWYFNG